MSDTLITFNRDGALQRLMNNETLLNRILEIFFGQAEARFSDIRQDIQLGRYTEARATAHGLKGSAGEVGAERLHRCLGDLEKALTGNSAQAEELYKVAVVEYQQFSQQARQPAID